MQRIKNAAVWGLSALTLTSVMLFSVACTRGNDTHPGDTTGGTTGGTTAVTTPATGNNGSGTTRPLDPGAGTVTPDGNVADPPAGTEGGTRGHSAFPRMIH
jgi:hypothetical protein